ncbi:MAG TPA: ABC transporter permease [Vicinamibacterales bacterium]|nr:ABC transporter permease [Vicinamibacterales bacterium]
MSLVITIVVAVKALHRNALRTTLTALGMIIGVAAVIVMVAIGTGARQSIENQIRSAGSNLVTVNAGSAGIGPVRQGSGAVTTLMPTDADAIRHEVPGIRYVSPGISTRTQVVAERANWNTTVQGAGEELLSIRNWPLQFGSFFTRAEVSSAAKVAVLGASARDELFGPGADAVGQTIRIRNQPFRVIGVLTSKGQAAMGPDQDDTVIVPYTAVQKRLLGVRHVTSITLSTIDGADARMVSDQVAAVLRVRHGIAEGSEDDFGVRTQEEMATVLTSTTDTMTYLLASIAAVSLLVGGIGIMNIMLVSVTERTREIGLRLAIGAQDVDVMTQFLVEAVVLSLAGGAIGVVLGLAISHVVSELMQWATVVTSQSILLSFGVAAATGVFFGFYPARKAATLDPIEALRYE